MPYIPYKSAPMPMSPRLLRPRASGSPGLQDAADWQARVVANGGSVSATTLSAVRTFCVDIQKAGIRSLFRRLNLFCGTGLEACLVPLYLGESRTGTQFGNITDTNANFVSGDYTETGTGGGLGTGATNSTKTLDTGLVPFAAGITEANSHCSFYSRQGNTSVGAIMAASVAVTSTQHLQYYLNGVSGSIGQIFRSGGNSNSGFESFSAERTGHLIAQRSAAGGALYRNGANLNPTSVTTGSVAFATGLPPAMRIYGRRFLQNNAESTDQYIATRLQAYSIGLAMTDAQALAYYNAMQTFQTTLGRNL